MKLPTKLQLAEMARDYCSVCGGRQLNPHWYVDGNVSCQLDCHSPTRGYLYLTQRWRQYRRAVHNEILHYNSPAQLDYAITRLAQFTRRLEELCQTSLTTG